MGQYGIYWLKARALCGTMLVLSSNLLKFKLQPSILIDVLKIFIKKNK